MRDIAHQIISPAGMIQRERSLPNGRGLVLVAVDDQVQADQIIVQPESAAQVPVTAGIRGRISRIIPGKGAIVEGVATAVSGALLFGSDQWGVMQMADEHGEFPQQGIMAVAVPLTLDMLQKARRAAVRALIVPSIPFGVLQSYLGQDSLAVIDRTASASVPFTLFVLNGGGNCALPMPLLNLLQSHAGRSVFLNRQSADASPELLLSQPQGSPTAATSFQVGAPVWIRSGVWQGKTGTILRIFRHAQVLENGIRIPSVRLHLESGEHITVPLANISLL